MSIPPPPPNPSAPAPYCARCGAPNPNALALCAHCGTNLVTAAWPPAPGGYAPPGYAP